MDGVVCAFLEFCERMIYGKNLLLREILNCVFLLFIQLRRSNTELRSGQRPKETNLTNFTIFHNVFKKALQIIINYKTRLIEAP